MEDERGSCQQRPDRDLAVAPTGESTMKPIFAPSLAGALLAALALPAAAQSADTWTGGYIGGHIGLAQKPDDSGSDRFLFDTDLDGRFGDTVRTSAGADAFSPGFCNGAARERTPAGGCSPNFGGADWGIRGGYDWQAGQWVFGIVGEYSMNDVRDAVSAFSTTPAFYTMFRKIDGMAALRGRAGYAFGAASENLVYATAGLAYARIENEHTTSNGVNAFTTNGDHNADGYQLGAGYERRVGASWSLGLEYLFTSLEDEDFRVRASRGNAGATNPFILVNPAGTDFRRSDTDFDFGSIRFTATYRF
jgi:outer membrane immunogenic protein